MGRHQISSWAAALAGVALLPTSTLRVDVWELLGTRRVSFAAERDVIEVGIREGGGEGGGAFTAIRIEVVGGVLDMYNIRLTFGNGDTWSPDTRVAFREGSWSRTIDLPGPARVIRRIEFWYRSRLRRGQATVRVFGRSAAGAGPVAIAPALNPAPVLPPGVGSADWDHLGMRQVDFRVDHDAVVAVGRGAFRSLRIDVEGGDLEMFDIKITFGNGETFSPATRVYFREGARSRVIDLPGAQRIIRRIDFFYRSVFGGGQGRATVHVYGRR
ncbi:MAG TPA: hypothetical protein VGQ25_01030 [Gemmatimonadales bacterium]|jgi:hypothetical protein|nr:hypothetical protein [Gemmatimonadales bacterium]